MYMEHLTQGIMGVEELMAAIFLLPQSLATTQDLHKLQPGNGALVSNMLPKVKLKHISA